MHGLPALDGLPGGLNPRVYRVGSVKDLARGGVASQEKRNMFCIDWLHAGGATRGKPAPNRQRRRYWRWGLLAGIALLQTGCQSGPFSHCGDGSSGLFGPCGFFSRVSDRVFTRNNRAGDCCEPGVVSGGTVVEAVPSAVVTPGVSSPYPPSSTRIITTPGSTDSSTELSPTSPDPTAKSRLSSPSGNGASRSGTGPQGASYQTRGQDSGRGSAPAYREHVQNDRVDPRADRTSGK